LEVLEKLKSLKGLELGSQKVLVDIGHLDKTANSSVEEECVLFCAWGGNQSFRKKDETSTNKCGKAYCITNCTHRIVIKKQQQAKNQNKNTFAGIHSFCFIRTIFIRTLRLRFAPKFKKMYELK